MSDCTISFGEVFLLEKTSDKFLEVKFNYGRYTWDGALPIEVQSHGFSITENQAKQSARQFAEKLTPKHRETWKTDALSKWRDRSSQTFKVFEALLSGEWECRGCGPVPQVNPQPAARIRDIKKSGFFIASRRKFCRAKCNNTQMHDLLVMINPPEDTTKNELRKPIPPRLAEKIISRLGRKESVFDQVRTSKELVIDHKFPSQRWSKPESDNTETMSDSHIKSKFQLLNNQTNLLKSRECDRCVSEGVRGQFMGIRWYYSGDGVWRGAKDDEKGCVGCPWYDLDRWKEQLKGALRSSSCGVVA